VKVRLTRSASTADVGLTRSSMSSLHRFVSFEAVADGNEFVVVAATAAAAATTAFLRRWLRLRSCFD